MRDVWSPVGGVILLAAELPLATLTLEALTPEALSASDVELVALDSADAVALAESDASAVSVATPVVDGFGGMVDAVSAVLPPRRSATIAGPSKATKATISAATATSETINAALTLRVLPVSTVGDSSPLT